MSTDHTPSHTRQSSTDLQAVKSSTADFEKSLQEVEQTSNLNLSLSLTDEEKASKVEELAVKYGINHRNLMWKIDVCVVPPFCLLYFLSFLDRVNVSNARVYGMVEDLNLKGTQYNTALTVFFVPYVFFEVLSNYALKYVAPHIWLSGCILCFGAVSIGMAFVTNFGGLTACRFLLGVFESGSFPALFYILANFYHKTEAQKRFSAFFSVTCLAGAAGGAMAYRINDLDGVHGLRSWQWIFLIDGVVTAGCSIILFFTIADFPEQARFLKSNEREFIKAKLEIYSGNSGFETKTSFRDVLKVFKDPLIWIAALAYFGLIIPSYGYAYFAATIINQMGYSAVSAQQHSIYPWLLAFFMGNIMSYISDKSKKRLPYVFAMSVMAIVGLAMILGDKTNAKVRYGGCFLAATGLYTAMPILVCWTSLNYGGHLRKSVGTAWQIGFGNIGGIIATFIFLSKDAPYYVPGLSVSIAFVCFSMLCSLVYFLSVYRMNKIKKTEKYLEKFDALSDRQKILQGDKNPEFLYLY